MIKRDTYTILILADVLEIFIISCWVVCVLYYVTQMKIIASHVDKYYMFLIRTCT